MRFVCAAFAVTAFVAVGGSAQAEALSGERAIWLHPQGGEPIEVGLIRFAPQAGDVEYEVIWDEAKFSDHFLSMRPFKCLDGVEKTWCRIPYPYEIRRRISEEDLTDLEYDLLFLWKDAGSYGIEMWNGVYYQLEVSEDGLSGRLHEVDMDILAAPPPPGELRPISDSDLEEGDPDSHWLPRITLR